MFCIERLDAYTRRVRTALGLGAAIGLAACAAPVYLPPPASAPAPSAGTGWGVTPPPASAPAPTAAPRVLPPVNDWAAYRLRAAQLITDANPGATYDTKVPDPVYAIPVIEVELNADGSVRNVTVSRVPTTEPELAPAAVAAVRRVANFGPVANLPQPWRFSEVFLYNDDKRFQLRTLAVAAGN